MRRRKLEVEGWKCFAVLAACALLAGCATAEQAGAVAGKAWGFYNENYARSLTITPGANGLPQVAYTISARPPAAAVSPAPAPSAFTQAQMADLMAHFAQYAIKDGKAVVPPAK